jgi:hypothetical protein
VAPSIEVIDIATIIGAPTRRDNRFSGRSIERSSGVTWQAPETANLQPHTTFVA